MKLTVKLTPEEKAQVGEYVENLFMAQDRPLTEEKKAILVDGIAARRYPLYAILQGLDSLKGESLKQISLAVVCGAIDDHMPPESVTGDDPSHEECKFCGGSGVVSMLQQPSQYSFAFRCNCPAGMKPSNAALPRWNGQEYQKIGNVTYRYWFPKYFEKPVEKIA